MLLAGHLVGGGVVEIRLDIPPFHGCQIRRAREGKEFEIKIKDPINKEEHRYKPKAHRQKVEERSRMLKDEIENVLKTD